MPGPNELEQSAPLLPTLFNGVEIPAEVTAHIFSFLNNIEDTLRVKQLDRNLRRIGFERQLQLFLEDLKGSRLWRYLTAIVENKNISTFVGGWIKHKEPITIETLFPNNSVEKDYIINQAKFILGNVNTQGCSNLKEFLKISLTGRENQHKIFIIYKKLEETFALIRVSLLLTQSMSKTPSAPSRRLELQLISIISQPEVNLWLSPDGLMHLNDLYPFHDPIMIASKPCFCLIESLIEITLSTKNSSIDNLISKMREVHWLNYLSVEDDQTSIHSKRNIQLVRAIEANHPIVLSCTEAVLLKLIRMNNETQIKILNSSIATTNLSDDALIKLCGVQLPETFNNLLNNNSSFLNRFDCKLTIKLMCEKNALRSYALALLKQETFLLKLKLDEIPQLTKYLTSDYFIELLAHSTFLSYLKNSKERSQLIFAIIKDSNIGFPWYVINNPTILKMLEKKQLEDILLLRGIYDENRNKVCRRITYLKTQEISQNRVMQSPIEVQPIITSSEKEKTNTGIKIAGLFLLAAVGVALIATGAGAIVGIPLLLQAILITAGSLCMITTFGLSIYTYLSRNSHTTNSSFTKLSSSTVMLYSSPMGIPSLNNQKPTLANGVTSTLPTPSANSVSLFVPEERQYSKP